MHLKNSEKTFLISREKRLGVGGFFLEFTFEEFFKFTLDALIGMNPLTCLPAREHHRGSWRTCHHWELKKLVERSETSIKKFKYKLDFGIFSHLVIF